VGGGGVPEVKRFQLEEREWGLCARLWRITVRVERKENRKKRGGKPSPLKGKGWPQDKGKDSSIWRKKREWKVRMWVGTGVKTWDRVN